MNKPPKLKPSSDRTSKSHAARASTNSVGVSQGTPATATADAAAEPLVFRFFTEIGIIDQLANNQLERVLPKGLSTAQFGVLNHFSRLGGERTLVELAKLFQVSKPAMTKLVQKLAAQGLLAVSEHPTDARSKQVRLTPAGKRAREACIVALQPVLATFEAAFPSVRLEKLMPLLSEMRIWLDTQRD